MHGASEAYTHNSRHRTKYTYTSNTTIHNQISVHVDPDASIILIMCNAAEKAFTYDDCGNKLTTRPAVAPSTHKAALDVGNALKLTQPPLSMPPSTCEAEARSHCKGKCAQSPLHVVPRHVAMTDACSQTC